MIAIIIDFRFSWQLNPFATINYAMISFQQTKRKLDDVSKRLESLYDLLRENRVSLIRITRFSVFVDRCDILTDFCFFIS